MIGPIVVAHPVVVPHVSVPHVTVEPHVVVEPHEGYVPRPVIVPHVSVPSSAPYPESHYYSDYGSPSHFFLTMTFCLIIFALGAFAVFSFIGYVCFDLPSLLHDLPGRIRSWRARRYLERHSQDR